MKVHVLQFWSDTSDSECGEPPDRMAVVRDRGRVVETLMGLARECDISYLRGCGSTDPESDRRMVVNAFQRQLGAWLEEGDGDVGPTVVESVGPMAIIIPKEMKD
jgi:hypothetical protein